MHRVIIPVDFSETSLNAARFTAQMLAGKKDAIAILYHNYETHDDHDICINYLETLKKEFIAAGVASVQLEYETGGDLIDNISRLTHTLRATLVVMGIAGKSAIKQAMFGSNTLKLVDKNLYPVMIVPPDAVYKGISNVAFASDYKNIETTTPSTLINAVLEMFSAYKIEFYFITMNDFFEALDNFVKDYAVDVLITIPKHQSNSTSLFKSTHTKRLAYHSHIPILAAHE